MITILPTTPEAITVIATEVVSTVDVAGSNVISISIPGSNIVSVDVLGNAGPKGDIGPAGSSDIVFVTREIIAGENLDFTLANVPVAGSEMLFLNGLALFPGNDYSISGATITMIEPVSPSDIFFANYRR